jgi:hypothetical protein
MLESYIDNSIGKWKNGMILMDLIKLFRRPTFFFTLHMQVKTISVLFVCHPVWQANLFPLIIQYIQLDLTCRNGCRELNFRNLR